MPAKTYQYSGKFEWDTQTKSVTKNGQPISGQDKTTMPEILPAWDITLNVYGPITVERVVAL